MVDMESLALQLYNGKVVPLTKHDSVIEENQRQLKELSCQIADANKKFFVEKLRSKLTDDEFCEIKNVDTFREQPHTDRYGRCTNFYVSLGPQKLWLY